VQIRRDRPTAAIVCVTNLADSKNFGALCRVRDSQKNPISERHPCFPGKLRIKQQERHAAEMVAVEMRDEYEVEGLTPCPSSAGSDDAPQSIRKLTRSPVT
jgi:hypothetical protein